MDATRAQRQHTTPEPEWGRAIATITKILMAKHGIEPATLADALGKDQSGVTRRLRHGKSWQLEDLFRMAELFDEHPSVFLSDPDDWGRRSQNGDSPIALAVIDGEGLSDQGIPLDRSHLSLVQ